MRKIQQLNTRVDAATFAGCMFTAGTSQQSNKNWKSNSQKFGFHLGQRRAAWQSTTLLQHTITVEQTQSTLTVNADPSVH